MGRSVIVVLVSITVLFWVFSAAFRIHPVRAGIITVPDNYPTIQEAINVANVGDTIYVHNGTYHENELAINKSVLLVGESRETTIIDGGGESGFLVKVTSDNVTITGFTIRHTAESRNFGLDIRQVKNCNISGNSIMNNQYGITVVYSSNVSIVGNNIIGNELYGLELYSSSNNSIIGNNILNNNLGVWVRSSSSNNITGNNCDGILLAFSSNNNHISKNNFVNKGLSIAECYENVVDENLVNGKPLIYLEGASDKIIDEAGQVILVNCSNIHVKDLRSINMTVSVELWSTSNTEIIRNEGVAIGIYSLSNNNSIAGNDRCGIELSLSSDNRIFENNITGNSNGILLYSCSRNNISGNNITANDQDGIWLLSACLNNITGNNITNNSRNGIEFYPDSNDNCVSENFIADNTLGMWLQGSLHNVITRNRVVNNYRGIVLVASSNYNRIVGNNITGNTAEGVSLTTGYESSGGVANNTIAGNSLTSNGYGIRLFCSSSNKIFHNNFVQNNIQASVEFASHGNLWDDGYPSGGNYWSDYKGVDVDGDGIGDIAQIIDSDNKDSYPLMAPFNTFYTGTWNDTAYYVDIVSNSTVSNLYLDANPDQSSIYFDVFGEDEMGGFCRVAIPKSLLWAESNWTVHVNGLQLNYTLIADESCAYLYFTYNHSTKTIQIIGSNVIQEIPSILILPMFMMATLLAAITHRRRRAHFPENGTA